jgi:hypothetical protein
MTLNMRNYRGFNRQPFCEAHIPKAKATTMAETPELERIAKNTRIQSSVLYHAEFEKAKGKFTQVAEDPETLRIKQNWKIVSNVSYHGQLERKAAMEQRRVVTGENGEPLPVQAPPPAGPINHRMPGKIEDYDPLVDAPRNSIYSARQSATVIYTSDQGSLTSLPSRQVGSIAALDPDNNL